MSDSAIIRCPQCRQHPVSAYELLQLPAAPATVRGEQAELDLEEEN